MDINLTNNQSNCPRTFSLEKKTDSFGTNPHWLFFHHFPSTPVNFFFVSSFYFQVTLILPLYAILFCFHLHHLAVGWREKKNKMESLWCRRNELRRCRGCACPEAKIIAVSGSAYHSYFHLFLPHPRQETQPSAVNRQRQAGSFHLRLDEFLFSWYVSFPPSRCYYFHLLFFFRFLLLQIHANCNLQNGDTEIKQVKNLYI